MNSIRVHLRSSAAVLLFAASAHAAPAELRGTWVTTTGLSTGTIRNAQTTATNFARLRAIGLNTVYQDIWRNGQTYFPSATMRAMVGGTGLASDAGRDVLAETLIQAHRNGMNQYGWLQYGFAAQYLNGAAPSNALAVKAKNNGWLLQDAAGNYTNDKYKFAWMNPLVPEVRKFIIDLGVEAVTKYDLDGIEFDDRLAWPTGLAYDDYTKKTYLAETGKSVPAATSGRAFDDFTAWRAGKITAFAAEFSTAIRKANPNAKVAAAPGIATVYNDYAVDTNAWARSTTTIDGVARPTFDEITPQVYSSTAGYFNSALNLAASTANVGANTLFAPGISIDNSSGPDYDWATVNGPQVAAQRAKSGTSGHIWWYSDGVLNTDEAALTAYYDVANNGQADRPDRPAGYRPAPTLAAASGAGKWAATPTELTRYSVIGLVGTTWSEILNTVLPDTAITLTTGGNYSRVELLVDRRGFLAGDANFDGKVDLADLAIWQANAGTAGRLWTQADFTLDGVVNDADLAILGRYWGTGTDGSLPALATLIPEPTTLAALAAFGLALTRRRRRCRR